MIPTSRGNFTEGGLLDELLYINYAHNRDIGMTAESGKWYPGAAVLEARYEAERAIAKAAS